MGIARSNRHDSDASARRSRSAADRIPPAGSQLAASQLAGRINRYRVTISSDFAASRDVQQKILDDVARRGFNTNAAFAIKLALEEALINAIKHGNRFDAGKKVYIEAVVSPTQVEIVVEDEGPGFDRAEVPDCTREENLEKCSGRGILLIESYMNQAEWTRGGRRLRMVKRNDADVLPRPTH